MLRHFSVRLIARVCLRQTAKKLNDLRINDPKLSLIPNTTELLITRSKYITSGVQGRRNSKTPPKKVVDDDEDDGDDTDELDENDDILKKNSDYEALASEALGRTNSIRSEENILILQPYIKWGPKMSNVSPDIKLQEAEDLIRSLDTWNITESVKVPLLGFGKRTFFGTGKLKELKTISKRYNGDFNQKVCFLSTFNFNKFHI